MAECQSPYIFIQSCISVRDGVPPDYLTGGEPHNDINVRGAPSHLVDIMAEAMRLGEQDLDEILGLETWSALVPTQIRHQTTYLGGRRQIQPLECPVDVGKGI